MRNVDSEMNSGWRNHWGTCDWPERCLLGQLDQAGRDRLLAAGEIRHYSAGEVLVREGGRDDFVLVLLSGMTKAVAAAFEGRDVLLAVRMGGDLVGELAVIDRRPRSATVIACGSVATAWISGERFRACLQQEPRVALAVTSSIAGKLRTANEYRTDFAGCDAKTRIARALYYLAKACDTSQDETAAVQLAVTQPEIATLCGVADPTGHRMLRKFCADQIISTGYGVIKIRDVDRLRKVAYG